MFEDADPWQIAMGIVAMYVAVVSLVRLMIHERQRLAARFRDQLQSQRREQARLILARKRRAVSNRPAGSHDMSR